jgi:hypothetical protein
VIQMGGAVLLLRSILVGMGFWWAWPRAMYRDIELYLKGAWLDTLPTSWPLTLSDSEWTSSACLRHPKRLG